MARSAVRLIRRFIAPRIINDFPLSSHFLFDRKFARATMQVLSKREIVGTGSVYVSRVLRFQKKGEIVEILSIHLLLISKKLCTFSLSIFPFIAATRAARYLKRLFFFFLFSGNSNKRIRTFEIDNLRTMVKWLFLLQEILRNPYIHVCLRTIDSVANNSIHRTYFVRASQFSLSRLQRLFSPLSRALQKRYNAVLTAPH